jgi:hypothetical protein
MADLNETAARALAEAAFKMGDLSPFNAAIKSASADVVARAYALCLTDSAFTSRGAPQLILREYLQLRLMQEHVAAQERMGRTINRLTFGLFILTAALAALTAGLFWFGYADYHSKKHDSVAAPQPQASAVPALRPFLGPPFTYPSPWP